ncbi:hypothetical protein [Vibrio sp. 10N.239.312.D08]|uniref:hypothetical protein n=1 Tax=Vibrio sp. 10N.239.312.D08 TaxID=3229978 RepID=UPI00354C590F
MNTTDKLLEYIASTQSVLKEHLKPVSCYPASSDWVGVASKFLQEKQCFSNSLNLSSIDGSDYVLGYVYMSDIGISIEHAWNRDQNGYFDLTAQLFWQLDTPVEYVELIRFPSHKAQDVFQKCKGVDHMALRMSVDYQYLFVNHKRSPLFS